MSNEPQIDPYKSLSAFFAYELRRAREAEGLSQNDLAAEIHTTRACVCAYETCARRPDREFAQDADKRLNTEDRLQIIHHHARKEHGSQWLMEFLEHEKEATSVKIYQSKAIHAFLQTEAYAMAMIAAGHPKDLNAAVAARLARQELLTREEPQAPYVWILMDQSVLLHMVGGVEVMRAQLVHLLKAGEFPKVTVQIVPFSAGAHWGMNGEFTILGLDEGDIAYTEAQIGGRLIYDPAEVQELGVRYDQIRAKALSEDASRKLINKTMGFFDEVCVAKEQPQRRRGELVC
ncbi:helix-turn-helix transcriptional regulator [Actinomadura vinacea]|uniref:Helix-turn-helix transcriptional regulator n=1 Tax=Actinomadura vinacea TaxID=115336 RepID=A0ABP5WS19_9ACTN